MRSYFRNFFLLPGIALFAWACSKDTPEPEKSYGPATPVTIQAPSYFGKMEVPENNPTTAEGVELGRMLFYEKMLSSDNTISCGSCHMQELAFTDGLAVSPGVNNAKGTRSSMTLANAGWFKQLMWDGAATTLEEQATLPILNHLEMNTNMPAVIAKLQKSSLYPEKFGKAFGSPTITEEGIVQALAQFQRTLVSSNSKFDRYLNHTENLNEQEMRGFHLFRTHPEPTLAKPLIGANCGDCHGSTGILALDQFKNNGLDAAPTDRGRGAITNDPFDDFKFKVPTLRNIALTAPYMHDGRFQTLEEVLDHYNEHVKMNSPNLAVDMVATNNYTGYGPLELTDQQKKDVIAFLHTLTDDEFITNPAFSDPFK